MHHHVSLKMTQLSSQQMLSQWLQTHARMKESLRLLETDWPQAMASIHCLADYLTDALVIDGHSIFELCLCNALGAYEDATECSDQERLWHFIESLTWTAASALTGIRLRDPDNFEWAAVDGVYLHSWLRSSLKTSCRPNRMRYLESGRVEVLYVTGHSTTKRLQQVLKARIMTPAVASLLEFENSEGLYEQA